MLASAHARRSSLAIVYVLLAALVSLLTACPRPLLAPTGASGGAQGMALDPEAAVSGHVDFGARKTQATIKDDVAPGATVSLIEVTSGQTLATTFSQPDGRFVLQFSNGFKPVSGGLYYFEAVKGLSGPTGQPNAVGADAVRVRTIASYRRGGWVTLSTKGVTTSISLSPMTTALSVVVSLRTGTAKSIDPTTLFGAIRAGQGEGGYPDALTLPDPTLVPPSMVYEAYDLVVDALAKERDPIRWITLDSADLTSLSLPTIPFSIKYLLPSMQEVGQKLDLVGVNFAQNPADNKVSFTTDGGWVPVTEIGPVSADLTRLTVTVPNGAISGPVRLEIGGKMLSTDPDKSFSLAVIDGHSVVRVLDRKAYLFVANPAKGTISKVTPEGEVVPFLSGLTSPQALTFGPDGCLYVACGGAKNQIVRITLTAALTAASSDVRDYSTPLVNPTGLAFDMTQVSTQATVASAPLYAVTGDGQLYRLPWTGALENVVPVLVPLQGASLSGPRGISFGYKDDDWRLWIPNAVANNVVIVDPATGQATVELSGIGKPSGVAFDSKGNLYISSNTGNSIFRREAGQSELKPFSSVPTPAGLDADASGYIYCADNVSNRIYMVNSQGESRMLATGISYPLGVHADADGIFVVTEIGQILRIAHGSGVVSLFADGLSNPMSLGRDSDGNFYVHQPALKQITRLATVTDASGRLSGMIDSYLPVSNVRDIHVAGRKLYLQKTLIKNPQGEDEGRGGVEIRDLSDWGTPESLYTGLIRDGVGMSFDNSTGAFQGALYLANFTDNSIVRMDADAANPPRGKIRPFLKGTQNPKLVRPNDVWVDPANGNVWVSIQGINTDTDGLIVLDSAGVELKDYSTLVNRPRKLGFDETHLYLTNEGGNEVIRIDRTTGAKLASYAVPKPLSLAFDTATDTMYVGSNDGQIYRITGYRTATPAAAAPFHALHAYDLYFHTDNYLYAANSSTWKIEQDGSTRFVYRRHYGQIYDFAKRASDGKIFHLTRDGRFDAWTNNHVTSSGTMFTGGSSAVPDGKGNWVSVFETICGGKSLIVGDLAGTFQQYAGSRIGMTQCWVTAGSMTSDGDGKVFVVSNPQGRLHRYDVATGVLEHLPKTGGAYNDGDQGLGVAAYNDRVYVTMRNRHVVDVFNADAAAAGAFIETLNVGLVNPEL